MRLPWYQVDRTDCLCVDWTGVASNRKMETSWKRCLSCLHTHKWPGNKLEAKLLLLSLLLLLFVILQQYVQGDSCMIQDCWSYLPKDWWVEAEELFHLWSQDTEQSFTFALPATVSSEVNLLLCNTIQLYAVWSNLFWGNIKRFMSEVKELVHL